MAELVIRRGLEEPDTSAAFTPHKPQRPAKSMGGRKFELVSEYQPAGDQPTAIRELTEAAREDERTQVLLGVTGSGKTFTMAKVIEELQRPALILAPNKILAAQLYGEFASFFPNNAVEYFVSYYDYYQPEAYVPRSDTYIEKESSVNEAIDRMRHSATRALLERDDVIIVASVSCIYGIGSVETYGAMTQDLIAGLPYDQRQVIASLVEQQYRRNDTAFQRGNFRVRGDSLEIWPAHLEDRAWRLSFFGEELESVQEFDPLTGQRTGKLDLARELYDEAITREEKSGYLWFHYATLHEQDQRWGDAAQAYERSTTYDSTNVAAYEGAARAYMRLRNWRKAVTKTFDWVDDDVEQ